MARRYIVSVCIDLELNENINKYIASQKQRHSKSFYVEQAGKMRLQNVSKSFMQFIL